jgi:threonine/homoserine/homoserine lactone efflux protein
VWLGVGLLRQAARQAPAGITAAGTAAAVPFVADFRRGLLTNVLNPKVALFFLAFLPQFVPAQSAHKTGSFLLLGGIFVVQGLLFLLVTVGAASRLRRWQTGILARRVLGALGGLLFITLALRLLGARPSAV